MRIYLACARHDAWNVAGQPHRVLASYASWEKISRIAAANTDIFIDSGAFTAWKSGSPILRHEYLAHLNRWGHRATVCANLDVIGDPNGTATNQEYFEQHGHNVLPVYHWGEPYDYFAEMCDRYKYIACGGTAHSVTHSTEGRYEHHLRLFEVAKKYKTKLHGFGVTEARLLTDLPWYSCDSSSWTSFLRFGNATLFSNKTGKFHTVKLSPPTREVHAHRWLLDENEIEMSLVLGTHSALRMNTISKRIVKGYERCEEYVTKLFAGKEYWR